MFDEDAGFEVENHQQDKDPEYGFVFLAFDKPLQIKRPFFAFAIGDQARDHGRHLFAIIPVSIFKFFQ